MPNVSGTTATDISRARAYRAADNYASEDSQAIAYALIYLGDAIRELSSNLETG